MKATTLVLVLLLAVVSTDAGAQLAKNGAYLEVGGSGVVPTLNYERRVGSQWYGRVGLSYVTSETLRGDDTVDRDSSVVVPLTASWVGNPQGRHHLEAGGGVTIAGGDRQDLFDLGDDDEQFSAVIPTALIGYRYQPPGRHFQFQAVATPVMADGEIFLWSGLSFGYSW